jgi:type VI secretion system protein ImpM
MSAFSLGAQVAGSARVVDRLYFGKLPSRGDFIRSDRHHPVMQNLDDWMSQTMERLTPDPRWKLTYDGASPVDFAILGVRGGKALAGHWLASQDASGRRFPFVSASVIDIDAPARFVPQAPVALGSEWGELAMAARRGALQGSEGGELDEGVGALLTRPAQSPLPLASADDRLQSFMDQHSVVSLEQMLMAAGTRLSVRQALLALGLLLQPVISQGAQRLSKGLCLPLPRDAGLQSDVAAFWLSLVIGFFERTDTELALFMLTGAQPPMLVLGFQGASAATLHAVIDPEVRERDAVHLDESDWVESCVDEDWGLKKLSNYLKDPSLSLQQARQTYREVFMGAGS